jgi:hypothetical protein
MLVDFQQTTQHYILEDKLTVTTAVRKHTLYQSADSAVGVHLFCHSRQSYYWYM